MKFGSSLALICVGAILAFAVTTNTSVFNLHTAGWVVMLIGVIGLVLPGRYADWVGRRLLVRRTYSGGRPVPPPYVSRDSGVVPVRRELPSRPTLLEEPQDLIDEAEAPDYRSSAGPVPSRPTGTTEVIEDLYEEP